MRLRITLTDQLKSYSKADVKFDLVAGLTVAVILIPQGMAYAMLAGFPPIYGLYAGLVPLMIYPFFGSSRALSVGPVALVSILILSGLTVFAEAESVRFIELAILTSLLAGLIQIFLSVFRMGFLINFLSHPVILGFTTAAAFIIGVSQLEYVLGLTIPKSNTMIATITDLIQNISDCNIYSLAIGLGGIIFLLSIKKLKPGFPAALAAVILSILLVSYFQWHLKGVEIVKEVPSGLPGFVNPVTNVNDVILVLPLALIICLISFIESLAIAKTIASKHRNYKINADQELMALGIAKLAGSFFQAFPNTGSFTRSAINDQSGAKTGISSIFAAVFVAMTLLLFTQYFYYLPRAILASIVIMAVISLINIKEIKHIYANDKNDFLVLLLTFTLTFFLGIQVGVLAGVILSIMFILYKTSQPTYAVLGNLPGTKLYRNIKRYPESQEVEDVLIFRLDASLYFGNAEYFYEKLNHEINNKLPALKVVILDTSSMLDIDTTGMAQIKLILDELQEVNIRLLLAGTLGPLRDILERSGITDAIGEENHFVRINDAINAITGEGDVSQQRRNYAKQYNSK